MYKIFKERMANIKIFSLRIILHLFRALQFLRNSPGRSVIFYKNYENYFLISLQANSKDKLLETASSVCISSKFNCFKFSHLFWMIRIAEGGYLTGFWKDNEFEREKRRFIIGRVFLTKSQH